MNQVSPILRQAKAIGFTGQLPNGATGIKKNDDGTYSISLADGSTGKYKQDGSIFTPPASDNPPPPASEGDNTKPPAVSDASGTRAPSGSGNGAGGAGGSAGSGGSAFGFGYSQDTSGDIGYSMMNGSFNIDPAKFMRASGGLFGAINLVTSMPFGLGGIFGQGLIGSAINNFVKAVGFRIDYSRFFQDSGNDSASADSSLSSSGAPVTAGDGQQDTSRRVSQNPETPPAQPNPPAQDDPQTPQNPPAQGDSENPPAQNDPQAPKAQGQGAQGASQSSGAHQTQGAKAPAPKARTAQPSSSNRSDVITTGKWKGYRPTSKAGVYIGKDNGYYRANPTTGKIYRCTGPSGTFKYSAGTVYPNPNSKSGLEGCDYGNGNMIFKEGSAGGSFWDSDARFFINGGRYNLKSNHNTLDYWDMTGKGTSSKQKSFINTKDGSFNPNAPIFNDQEERNARYAVRLEGSGKYNGCTIKRISVGPKSTPKLAIVSGNKLIDFEMLMKTGQEVLLTANK